MSMNRRKLLEVAHEVGGGFGGFFDLGDIVGGGMGVGQAIGKEVGIGADHTEKIVEGVGDRFEAIGREAFIIARVDNKFHLRSLSEMRLSFVIGMGGDERGVEHVSGELIEREAMRGAGLLSLFVQILYGGIEQREDRDGRIFGANLLDDMQAVEAPGMKIDGQGIPAAVGQ